MTTPRAKNPDSSWRLQGQEGVQAIEMALVLPILLTMVFGMIDFGLVLYTKEVMANASREGARQGIRFVTPMLTDSDIETITKDTLTQGSLLDPTKATVNVTNAGGGFGTDLTVDLQYTHDFIAVGGLVPGIPNTITLQSTTVMSNE